MSREPRVILPLRDTPVHLVGPVLASQSGTLAGIPADAVMTATGITFRLTPREGGTRHLALDFRDLLEAVRLCLGQEEADRLANLKGEPRDL